MTGATTRSRLLELAGWLLATAVSLLIVVQVATTRSDLLFTDGDSVFTVLLFRSLAAGDPQDWAVSPVLFLPESLVYSTIALLGMSIRATLAANALLNLLALYGALRVVSGRRSGRAAPVLGALLAFGVFGTLALLEGSAEQGGYRLATLLTTTTYYSATVLGTVLTVGFLRRAMSRRSARPTWPLLLGIALTAAISTLTNPLFVLWAALPSGVVLLALWTLGRRKTRATVMLVGALAVGALVGYLARGPFAANIVATQDNYFRLSRWRDAADHIGSMLRDTLASPAGVVWILLVATCMAVAIVVLVAAVRRRDSSAALVAGVALLSPIFITVASILAGTDADRYLQPWVFLTVLPAAVLPGLARRRPAVSAVHARRQGIAIAVVATAALVVTVGIAAPRLAAVATRAEPDLDCVRSWIATSDRVGAGQFWAIRAPKAYADDPARLVQITSDFEAYEWLVNRAEPTRGPITFLIQGPRDSLYVYPPGVSARGAARIDCGVYTILDFGDTPLPLLGARS